MGLEQRPLSAKQKRDVCLFEYFGHHLQQNMLEIRYWSGDVNSHSLTQPEIDKLTAIATSTFANAGKGRMWHPGNSWRS